MGVSHLSTEDRNELLLHGVANSRPELEKSRGGLPRLVKAEANLLRLPLFALQTKRLKSLDGIECRGRITRDGETHQFIFKATRNSATLYPGPLARSAHLAFLSIITEHGLPFANPIMWSWRDLCRRMGVVYGGKIVRELKAAITATALLGIQSEYALFSKTDTKPMMTREHVLHLYEWVAFLGSQTPDGKIADTNYLWLSDWYLQNINAMFTAPLDYELWRFLDASSTIASRLYEFLLLNFYSGISVFKINYETLAQFLPIKPEPYRSKAKQQMHAALQLLIATKVIAGADWANSKKGIAQLHLHRGQRLNSSSGVEQSSIPFAGDEFMDAIKLKELRNLKPPERGMVEDFYRLWSGLEPSKPTKLELDQATELIGKYGTAKAKALIPLVVEQLREKWPEAKAFGAIIRYIPDALEHLDRQERRSAWEREQEEQHERQRAEEARKRIEEQEAERIWQALSEGEQEIMRQRLLQKHPHARKHPKIIERFCLGEIIRQRKANAVTTAESLHRGEAISKST